MSDGVLCTSLALAKIFKDFSQKIRDPVKTAACDRPPMASHVAVKWQASVAAVRAFVGELGGPEIDADRLGAVAGCWT